MAATSDSLLGTFQKHIDDMRALIHCKICLKPFYEPFSLTCGHTYCYSCLSSWVNRPHNQNHNKNCPDCRQPIKTEPSPNFTLRDLVHMFVKRAELLPEDETIQEHEHDREAEAKALADDKKGPGLFKAKFSKRRGPFFGHPVPIRDPGDGVDRCPLCTWELEDGMCNACGWGVDTDDDLDTDDSDDSLDGHHISLDGYDSEDDDRDISPIDDIPGQYGHPFHGAIRDLQLAGRQQLRQALNIAMQEEEPDSEMDDFIENDYPEEIDHDDDDDESVVTPNAYNPGSPPAQYGTDNGDITTDYDNDDDDPENEEDDDDDDDEPRGAVPRRIVGEYMRPIEVDNSDSDLESQTMTESINPIPLNAALDSDSDSDSDTTTQATTHDNDTASEAPTTEENKSDDSDDSSVLEISPPPVVVRGRKRRVVESEDEDIDDGTDDTDDTAIRAPQTAAARAGRLTARRGGKVTLKYSRGGSNHTSGSTRRVRPSPSPSPSDTPTPTPSPQRLAPGSHRARRGNPDQRLRLMRERLGTTVF